MKLTLVPTPIGNLRDITLRSLDALKSASLILCEDTRQTKKLLQLLEIDKPVLSYHAHNEHQIIESILQRIIAQDNIVLVSDAGTPGISDPGFLLVRACIQAGIEVECHPGPTAFVPALVASGLPMDRFVFEGFLPHKKGRQSKLLALKEEERTIIFYESPFRIKKLLSEILELFGEDRQVCVVKELTKIHESYFRGSLTEVDKMLTASNTKGEFVVILSGKAKPNKKQADSSGDD